MRSKIIIAASIWITLLISITGSLSNKDFLTLEEDLADKMGLTTFNQIEPTKFRKMLQEAGLKIQPVEAPRKFSDVLNFLDSPLFCIICKLAVPFAGIGVHVVDIFRNLLCFFISLITPIPAKECNGFFETNLPIFKFIVHNSKIFYSVACSIWSNSCGSNDLLNWTANITSYATKKIPQKVPSDPSAKPLKIVHLSDIHISTDYEVGGAAECGYLICCKKGLVDLEGYKGIRAGVYGNYAKCDIPWSFFMETVKHINSTEKDIDMIYFTGDIIDHTIWKSNRDENAQLITNVFKTLKETFPNAIVLPVLGNHEAAPLDTYPPPSVQEEQPDFSQEWLYDLVADLWKPWLNETSLETVRKQGYYAHTFTSKLKIIALNNNICYRFNWWLLYDFKFLEEQLNFLKNELEDSEAKEQFVHIIAHQPTGNGECIRPWERSYVALVRRFAHIIVGQFNGHTHTDELKIFFDENGEPINVGYNGASLTTFQNYNPNYKVMSLDRNTYELLDIHTYTMNLTLSNQNPDKSPQWYKLYSMKEDYKLKSFSPKELHRFVIDLFQNEALVDMYWRNSVRNGDASLKEGCDMRCHQKLRCRAITTDSSLPPEQCY
ncbi:unnamed protein product [Callosobruchus maculatus]|uniref:Sphingomyelin phosphodiesterase n=1 Tax=Callosobruchus maculatus TaxID=64391 RepID=A0A653C193_CALMS|nr:unnamed protein product [Callosobruchus maculatus]